MKSVEPRLLRYAAATRRHLAFAGLIGAVDAALLVIQAFAITGLVVRTLRGADAAGIGSPALVLGLVVLGRGPARSPHTQPRRR